MNEPHPAPSLRCAAPADDGPLYFVHVPKTAGITFKTFLENNLPAGTSLVIDEWEARKLSTTQLAGYRLYSGHYSAEILRLLPQRPRYLLALFRDPLARFRSWAAHCRRVDDERYRRIFEGHSDWEALNGPQGYTCYQSYWLARALRAGVDSIRVPSPTELPVLLDEIGLVGLTEELDRTMQLISFRLGWAPPPHNWRINRAPDNQPTATMEAAGAEQIRSRLEIDYTLYELAAARFWENYAAMLSELGFGAFASAESARFVPLSAVHAQLQERFRTAQRQQPPLGAKALSASSADPIRGEGWWWRECPGQHPLRWSGPATASTLLLPPLVSGRTYLLVVDAVAAANRQTWENLTLSYNGRQLPLRHEQIPDAKLHSPALRLHARFVPSAEEAARETQFTFQSHTSRALRHNLVEESHDTFHADEREVGFAFHRLTVTPLAVGSSPAPANAART